jgi:hypothetical protein
MHTVLQAVAHVVHTVPLLSSHSPHHSCTGLHNQETLKTAAKWFNLVGSSLK